MKRRPSLTPREIAIGTLAYFLAGAVVAVAAVAGLLK